jgi:hypothetical protein
MFKRKVVAALLTTIVLSLSTPAMAAPRFFESGGSLTSRLTRILQKFFGTGGVKSSASEMSVPKP